MRPEPVEGRIRALRQAQLAFSAALLGFDRLSPHEAAALLPAYPLGLSLTSRDCGHDRGAFCSLATDLLLWSVLLLKHGCFLSKKLLAHRGLLIRLLRRRSPRKNASLAPPQHGGRAIPDARSQQLSDVGVIDSARARRHGRPSPSVTGISFRRSGALRDAVEGRAHPIRVSAAKPRLRSRRHQVQGGHLLSVANPHRLAMYSLIRLCNCPWAAQSDQLGRHMVRTRP